MLLKLILDIRDFTYHWLVKLNGIEFAKKEHGFRVGVYFMLPYFVVTTAIYLTIIPVLPSLSTNEFKFLKYNFFANIIGGLLIFGPYYFISKQLLKYLATFPILEVDEKGYKRKRNITFIFFISCFLFLLLIFAISNYIRLGHF